MLELTEIMCRVGGQKMKTNKYVYEEAVIVMGYEQYQRMLDRKSEIERNAEKLSPKN